MVSWVSALHEPRISLIGIVTDHPQTYVHLALMPFNQEFVIL